jgi:curved DNA-binding protein CbpA
MPRPIRLPKPAPAKKKADPLDAAAAKLEAGADATTLLKQLDADPYACLGLSKTTDDAAVKKAYKKRALRFHPDKNKWDSTELFQALGWAFERLETSERRRAFAAERAPSASSSGPTEADDREARQRRAKAAKRAWQKAVGETLAMNTRNDRRSAETLEIKGRARQRRLQSVDEERRRRADQASQRRTSDFAAHRRVLRERRARRGDVVVEERTSFFVEKPVAVETSDPTRIACTFDQGPMGLELAARTAFDGDEACVVASVTGAAADLGVKKGDTLVSVNDDDLRGHGFDRCVAFVRRAREQKKCVLCFHRPRRRAASSGVSL